jgi:hypothetical protein
LLDAASELADRRFKAADTRDQISIRALRLRAGRAKNAGKQTDWQREGTDHWQGHFSSSAAIP